MDQFKQIYILLLLFILSVAGLRSIEKGPHTRVARIIEKFMDTYDIPGPVSYTHLTLPTRDLV